MRTGLVVLGVALAIVGGVLGYIGVAAPAGTTTHDLASTQRISAPNIVPFQTRTDVVAFVNTSSGTLSIAWNSTQPLAVGLYQGAPCASPQQYCRTGAPFASWPANLSGVWSRIGSLVSPLVLVLTNSQPTNTSFTAVLAEEYTASTPIVAPTWSIVTIFAGAGLLVAIGGVATFLGLFLRGGVYTEPEAVRPRYYAHELDGTIDPLDRPFDESAPADRDDGPEDGRGPAPPTGGGRPRDVH